MDAFRFAQSSKAALKTKQRSFFAGANKGTADAKYVQKTKREVSQVSCAAIISENPSIRAEMDKGLFTQWAGKMLVGLANEIKSSPVDEILVAVVAQLFLTGAELEGRAIQKQVEDLLRDGLEDDARIVAYAFMEQAWKAVLAGKFAPAGPPPEETKKRPAASPAHSDSSYDSPPEDSGDDRVGAMVRQIRNRHQQ